MNIYGAIEREYGKKGVFLLDDAYRICTMLKEDAVRQQLTRLTKENKIIGAGNGVYYIPKLSVTGKVLPIDFETALTKKYLGSDGDKIGYYVGLTRLVQLGISTQMPNKREIVTNAESTRKRVVSFCGKEVILRKSVCDITTENWKVLEFLDIAKVAYKYADIDPSKVSEILVREYSKKINIKDIVKYIEFYPAKVAKIILGELNAYEKFA